MSATGCILLSGAAMGRFDSLMVTCPLCGVRDEIQVKPCLVDGQMQEFDIETAHDKVLENAAFVPERCVCGCVHTIVDGPGGEGWSLRVGKDIPVKELPKRIEWSEKSSDCSSTLSPRVVCLCGSTKFKHEFELAAIEETLCGNIVLTVHIFSHYEKLKLREDTLDDLKRLHLAKIKMADEILVINVGGYIGEGLREELAYANSLGIPARWLEPQVSPHNARDQRARGNKL